MLDYGITYFEISVEHILPIVSGMWRSFFIMFAYFSCDWRCNVRFWRFALLPWHSWPLARSCLRRSATTVARDSLEPTWYLSPDLLVGLTCNFNPYVHTCAHMYVRTCLSVILSPRSLWPWLTSTACQWTNSTRKLVSCVWVLAQLPKDGISRAFSNTATWTHRWTWRTCSVSSSYLITYVPTWDIFVNRRLASASE